MTAHNQHKRDTFRDLHSSQSEGQAKYIYFLLAAAASGIGLVVSVTSDATLEITQIPLGIAVALWSVSFFYGARSLFHRNAMFGMNAAAIDMDLKHGGTTIGGVKTLEDEARLLSSKAARLMRRQFSTLAAGGVFFLLWHVLDMIQRTAEIS